MAGSGCCWLRKTHTFNIFLHFHVLQSPLEWIPTKRSSHTVLEPLPTVHPALGTSFKQLSPNSTMIPCSWTVLLTWMAKIPRRSPTNISSASSTLFSWINCLILVKGYRNRDAIDSPIDSPRIRESWRGDVLAKSCQKGGWKLEHRSDRWRSCWCTDGNWHQRNLSLQEGHSYTLSRPSYE